MAKANLCFTRIGNDGYKLARRTDGVWFIKECYFAQGLGWTTTKWQEINGETDEIVQTCLRAHAKGAKGTIVGFSHIVEFTEGAGLRLPKMSA